MNTLSLQSFADSLEKTSGLSNRAETAAILGLILGGGLALGATEWWPYYRQRTARRRRIHKNEARAQKELEALGWGNEHRE